MEAQDRMKEGKKRKMRNRPEENERRKKMEKRPE